MRKKNSIDPKDLMAVERATTALLSTSISLIILGFVIEKFELFLYLVSIEVKSKSVPKVPPLLHMDFYNIMGIAIVTAGIILSLYTYRYYTRWVQHLQKGIIDTDKNIYFILSVFIALIGAILLATMLVL